MYGNPGTGKTHTAIGLGTKACKAGYNVLYASVPRLPVGNQERPNHSETSRLQKRFEKYDLTILDECGYKSFDKEGAEASPTLISSVPASNPSSSLPTLASINGIKSSPIRSLLRLL